MEMKKLFLCLTRLGSSIVAGLLVYIAIFMIMNVVNPRNLFMGIYFVLFGTLIILSSWNCPKCILKWFPFMENLLGNGLSLIKG